MCETHLCDYSCLLNKSVFIFFEFSNNSFLKKITINILQIQYYTHNFFLIIPYLYFSCSRL